MIQLKDKGTEAPFYLIFYYLKYKSLGNERCQSEEIPVSGN